MSMIELYDTDKSDNTGNTDNTDKSETRRNDKQLIVGSIDLEWNQEFIEQEYVILNKRIRKRIPSKMLMGVWIETEQKQNILSVHNLSNDLDVSSDQGSMLDARMQDSGNKYYAFEDIDMFLIFIETFRNCDLLLYTYFMPAELVFFSTPHAVKSMIEKGWKIVELSKWEVRFENDRLNTSIILRDVKKITNTGNLDDFCRSMLQESSKDVLLKIILPKMSENLSEEERKKMIDHVRENLFTLLDLEEIKIYNREDVRLTLKAYYKFIEMINKVCDELNISHIHAYVVYSLGHIARLMISQLEEQNGSTFLNWQKMVSADKKLKKSKKEIACKEMMQKLLDIGKEMYQGGGITSNWTHLYQSDKIVNAEMYDVASLYPHSALLASRILSVNCEDYAVVQELTDYYKKHYDVIAMRVEGKWENNSLYMLAQRVYFSKTSNDTDEIYKTVYAKEVSGWYTKMELDEAVKAGFKITKVYDYLLRKKQYVHVKSVERFMSYFLEKKSTIRKEDDPAMYEITKLLMNIAYGKITERRVTSITNYLFSAFLTSISRAIMISLINHLRQHDIIVYHTATDSVICSRKCDTDNKDRTEGVIKEWEEEWKRKLNISWSFIKKEHSGKVLILSLKRYCFLDMKKEAHLGIHLRDRNIRHKFWEYVIDAVQQNDDEFLVFYIAGEYFLSFKDIWNYMQKYSSKHMFKAMQDLQKILQTMKLTDMDSEQLYKITTLLCGAGLTVNEQYFLSEHDMKLKLEYSKQFTVKYQQSRQWERIDEFKLHTKERENMRDKIIELVKSRLNGGSYKPKRISEHYKSGFKVIDLTREGYIYSIRV